jgi:hypothetical protein
MEGLSLNRQAGVDEFGSDLFLNENQEERKASWEGLRARLEGYAPERGIASP